MKNFILVTLALTIADFLLGSYHDLSGEACRTYPPLVMALSLAMMLAYIVWGVIVLDRGKP